MSFAANSVKVNLFSIASLDGQTVVDLAGSASLMYLDYFEDLLSPSIMLTVQVMCSTALLNTLPIRGGEAVAISIDTAFGEFELPALCRNTPVLHCRRACLCH
jgi:hypothetical protein